MQASLEAEVKGKNEAIKQKKKLEIDVNEIEIALDHSNKSNSELQKANKKLQQTINEQQAQIEDEQKQRNEAREAAALSERRANQLQVDLEESRTVIEQVEKSRKAIENELHDAADKISELSSINSNLAGFRRKLENELTAMRVDLEDTHNELKNSEERVKKAVADAARLSEELRIEQVCFLSFEGKFILTIIVFSQEHASNVEKVRKGLEQQLIEFQIKLDQAESNALKGGKRILQKMEQRVLTN